MSFCMMSRTSPGLGTLRGRFSFSALEPCAPPYARNSCIGGYVAHSNIGVRTSDAAHLHQYVTVTEAGRKRFYRHRGAGYVFNSIQTYLSVGPVIAADAYGEGQWRRLTGGSNGQVFQPEA